MKRCPDCRRDYYDDSLLYCLDDGSALLEGPAASSGEATAVLRIPSPESDTRLFTDLQSRAETVNSIAVLPFVNMSTDPENEFFCDGLAEELLNALTKIESLKVAARTSAFSFKGRNANVGDIGRTLGVRTVLQGSVRKSGDQMRITVQLVNAADGYHIWSERYDREIKDIFAVQDEITLAVVDALKVKLLGSERSAVLKKGTDSPEAYELYMRGRFFWNRRTVADFERAIEQFELAIQIDPNFAQAYSGLADCLLFLGYYEACSPAEAAPKAKAAVLKALEMDDSLAEAHASMAVYRIYFEFDWKGGEECLLKAIELNPKLATAHYWYCSFLDAMGRFDEAIEQGRIALEYDPLSLITPGNIARVHSHAGRYDEAVALAQKSLEIAPDFYVTHWVLGVAYMRLGRMDRSIDHFRKAVASSDILFLKAFLGAALAVAGQTEEARRILDEFVEISKTRYVSPLCMAAIYVGLNEVDRALDWLERAWNERTVLLMWIKTEQLFDPLRGEPRFKTILNNMNFPD